MNYEIENEEWHTCKICSKKIRELAKTHGGCGVYYVQVFDKHLKIDHNITLDEYFLNYCNHKKPKCKCGICEQESYVIHHKPKFHWREYLCGRFPGIMEWSEKAKIERKGSGNPMFGKEPWNNGLTKETSESVKKMADSNTGKKHSEEHIQKLKDFQSTRAKEPHLGHKHTEENKEKQRQRTLKMIKDGVFKQTKTKPHIKLSEILQELGVEYEEEVIVDIWSFDFYIPRLNLYIEVDGDYFHSNPKIYPDGPKTKTQKINYYRDYKKNKYCDEQNIKLMRFWECDILNDEKLIKDTICRLVELSV